MKKKVLYIVTSFPLNPESLYSGIFNYRFLLGASSDVDFTVIHLRSWRPGRSIVNVWKLENSIVYQINFPYTEAFGTSVTSLLLTLYRKICYAILAKKVRGVELVHSVSVSLAGVVGAEFSSRLKLPHIAQCNGTDVNMDLKAMHRTRAFSKLSKNVQVFVCNSNALASEVKRIFPKANIQVIYRGVDLKKFKNCAVNQTGLVTFLFLGGLSFRKGQSDGRNFKGGISVLIANSHLYDVKNLPPFRIIFGGPDVNKELVNSILESHGLNGLEKLEIVGKLRPEEVPIQMKKSDVVLITSMMEGLPNIGMEAMASGRALIGTDVGGLPELIEVDVNGFIVKNDDPLGLAEKMEWCIRNRNDLVVMGKSAHKKIVDHFDFERGLELYLKLYDNVKI